jgi:hypothetical protein
MSASATAGVFGLLKLTNQGRYKQSPLSVGKMRLYLTHPKHDVKLINYIQVTHLFLSTTIQLLRLKGTLH